MLPRGEGGFGSSRVQEVSIKRPLYGLWTCNDLCDGDIGNSGMFCVGVVSLLAVKTATKATLADPFPTRKV